MYKTFNRFYEADSGNAGGAPTETGEGTEITFTPEQQAKIDALIAKSFAKGAAKAGKEAEEKAAREKQSEAERLAADRAALETEKARFKVQSVLAKEGFTVDDETDSAIVGLFAAPRAVVVNIAALKKLIEAKTNQAVDKRLQGAKQPAPKSGETGATVGDTINGLFRKLK